MSSAYDGPFRIGSLAFRLRTADEQDSDALSLLFKQPLNTGRGTDTHGFLDIVDSGGLDPSAVPADGLVVSRSDGLLVVASELMTAYLEQLPASWRARITVHDRNVSDLVYRMHLSIILHRLLLALGRAYLHAAAVTVAGRTFVFVGEKGAGKSSIAASLGAAGGTILSDDHVLLRAGHPHYVVSGCEPWARVTAETEAAVFERPLAVTAKDYAGTLKKEFRVGDFFMSRPHEDAPVAAVLFPHVGRRLRTARRTPRAAALDLIQRTRHSYRPQDGTDIQAIFDFWVGLAQAAPAFDLELSSRVGDLVQLGNLLDTCVRPS